MLGRITEGNHAKSRKRKKTVQKEIEATTKPRRWKIKGDGWESRAVYCELSVKSTLQDARTERIREEDKMKALIKPLSC